MSIKKLLEDILNALYEDGMGAASITMPEAMRKRLDEEMGGLEQEGDAYLYKGDFKTVPITVGEHFVVEVE